jgi:hypothetical protein
VLPPNGQDRLNVTAYYKGLASFIANCQTPMTIAVQGDWGSGKSTALNFVKSELPKDKVKVIEFNTWLYSQFDLGESLVFSMAHEIIRPIAKDSSTAKKLMRFVATMGAGVLKGGLDMAGAATGTAPLAAAMVESLKNATYADDTPSIITELKNIRQQFAASVHEYCSANRLDRVVILIDDLDRVDPGRAIEILESLKLFFEVPQCVFVLALDFDVVMRGVESRYGTDFKKKKARQYFDKIIQVPFAMPVASFTVTEILGEALDRSQVLGKDRDAELDKYLKLVRWSVGTNPRSIKRLLNSFELLQLILKTQGAPLVEAEERLPRIVFALLCAQAAYPELHRQIMEVGDETDGLEAVLPEGLGDENNEALAEVFDLEKVDVRTFRLFRVQLGEVSSNEDGELDLAVLQRAIKLSQVTSVGAARTAETTEGETAIGATDVLKAVRASSNERTAELLSSLANGLAAHLGNRDFSMVAQDSAKMVTLYTTKDVDRVLTLGPRSRPRFASIGYSRKGLNIVFGRSAGDSEDRKEPYGGEWDALVAELQRQFPDDGGPAGAVFRVRPTGYPLILDGIADKDGIGELCDVLAKVYDVVVGYRSWKELALSPS